MEECVGLEDIMQLDEAERRPARHEEEAERVVCELMERNGADGQEMGQ